MGSRTVTKETGRRKKRPGKKRKLETGERPDLKVGTAGSISRLESCLGEADVLVHTGAKAADRR